MAVRRRCAAAAACGRVGGAGRRPRVRGAGFRVVGPRVRGGDGYTNCEHVQSRAEEDKEDTMAALILHIKCEAAHQGEQNQQHGSCSVAGRQVPPLPLLTPPASCVLPPLPPLQLPLPPPACRRPSC